MENAEAFKLDERNVEREYLLGTTHRYLKAFINSHQFLITYRFSCISITLRVFLFYPLLKLGPDLFEYDHMSGGLEASSSSIELK
jgi:hypothetical protein